MSTRKVSYVLTGQRRRIKQTPFIRLRGHWLAQHGFNVGSAYTLRIESGNIILSPL